MTDGPRTPESAPELSQNAQIYEHMFPGNKWDSLRSLDPRSAPSIIKNISWDFLKSGYALEAALRDGKGFARRFSIPYPDKISVGLNLGDIESITDEMPQKGWFSDLLETGEQVGGLGMSLTSAIKEEFKNSRLTGTVGKDPTETHNFYWLKTVGIMGADGKPSGVIQYREGARERSSEKSRSRLSSLSGLVPKPSEIRQ